MSELKIVEKLFKGRHFDREVIILCVRWYLWFKVSLRDLARSSRLTTAYGATSSPHGGAATD
jgi:hypothetical protein